MTSWSPPILHAAVAAQRVIAVPPGVPPDILERLAAVVTEHSARRGLVVDPLPMRAAEMVLADGRRVALDLTPPYWHEVEAKEETIATTAIAMIETFAGRHGAGRVWSMGGLPLVHIICDDTVRWRRDEYGDGWVCRLRMLAAHEASASASAYGHGRIAVVTAHRPANGWSADVRPAPHPDGEVMHALWQEWRSDMLASREVLLAGAQHVEGAGHEPTWLEALRAGTGAYSGSIPGQCDRCAR